METLLAGGAFFESPRWHAGRWWFSDFFRHLVVAVDAHGEAEEILRVDGQPSGLGWLPDGSLLVVSMRDRRVLRERSGELSVYADLAPLCDWDANDLVVAADGTAYVGNFGFDLAGGAAPSPTALVRIAPDGSAERAAEGLLFPNGCVISENGGTLIVAETWASRLTEFTIAADGSLSEQRAFALLDQSAPDGCTLDAEGCVWFADARRGRCVRVARGGAIVEVLPVEDGLRCFACMLGGEDGCTLAVCAAPGYDEDARDGAVVLTTRVAVPHAGRP